MNTTDGVNQVVSFIYNDNIAIKLYSAGLSCRFVKKNVVW